MAGDDHQLSFSDPEGPGFGRRRAGRGFTYLDAAGGRLRRPEFLVRVRALAIPPAWERVWICPEPHGHIQAVGRDQRGRRQYIYHPAFRTAREEAKFEHLLAFANVLPKLRRRVEHDLGAPVHSRVRVLAGVVRLLETTLIRVGSPAYARDNGSFGLTTLKTGHVRVNGDEMRFHFRGKSGRVWRLTLQDRRAAGVVRRCQELPGQLLFQYVDEAGGRQSVTSTDVNAYLKEASGAEITAKEFRTWAATVMAGVLLAEAGPAAGPTAAKRSLAEAVRKVARRLGNTPTICRRCYIHPDVAAGFLEGRLELPLPDQRLPGLDHAEARVLAYLRAQISP